MHTLQPRIFQPSLKWLSISLVAWNLGACASSKEVAYATIHQANQCAINQAQLSKLDTQAEQEDLINKLTFLKPDSSRQSLRDLLTDHASREQLFLLAQGSKPTPGYGFAWLADHASIESATLKLPLRFTHPDKDAVLAQVLTSPCMIIGVDKKAQFKRIEAGDLYLDL